MQLQAGVPINLQLKNNISILVNFDLYKYTDTNYSISTLSLQQVVAFAEK